jgi:hypothetical protein
MSDLAFLVHSCRYFCFKDQTWHGKGCQTHPQSMIRPTWSTCNNTTQIYSPIVTIHQIPLHSIVLVMLSLSSGSAIDDADFALTMTTSTVPYRSLEMANQGQIPSGMDLLLGGYTVTTRCCYGWHCGSITQSRWMPAMLLAACSRFNLCHKCRPTPEIIPWWCWLLFGWGWRLTSLFNSWQREKSKKYHEGIEKGCCFDMHFEDGSHVVFRERQAPLLVNKSTG